MAQIELTVPDIGDYADVPVIEVLVQAGDVIAKEAPLVTLESEKATMEVPADAAGTVRDIRVKVGDRVSRGSVIVTIESADAAASHTESAEPSVAVSAAAGADAPSVSAPANEASELAADDDDAGRPLAETGAAQAGASQAGAAQTIELRVPDIGDFHDIPVIEVLVKAGDVVAKEAPLATLESEKATMEVPAEAAGTIRDVKIRVGDKISKGTVIATLETVGAASSPPALSGTGGSAPVASGRSTPPASSASAAPPAAVTPSSYGASGNGTSPNGTGAPVNGASSHSGSRAANGAGATSATAGSGVNGSNGSIVGTDADGAPAHASPAIRRFARELGVALGRVSGSGPNGRITRADVQGYVKHTLAAGPAATVPSASSDQSTFSVLPWPKVDFEKFGPVERQPLSRIKRLSGPNLHRNWVMIPHVTQNEDADVTELEAFRKEVNAEQKDAKVTMLAFLIKAAVAVLKRFPEVNSSLVGDDLVLKQYYNIGFAADTPSGLVVPVIRDADKKGVVEIARETSALAGKARDGKLTGTDMQGSTFTISSLGGIGGTYFTPIINAPEVAILGACKTAMKPVWNGSAFEPRLILPLSFSYDHRVIDGAGAARFCAMLATTISDLRRTLL